MEHATPAVLLLIVLFIGPVLYYIWRTNAGMEIFVRRIPGIDAIDAVIGRTVELGRPMSFTTGMTRLSPLLYACLGTLHYIGRKTALFGKQLFVPCSDPEVLVLTDATLQSAYSDEKKLSSYDASMLRFLSEEQFAYASGYQGLMHRENVGGAFLFGHFAAESLILAEAGQQIGAMQVAATTSPEQVPFFITACDYTLIGEELYAAGAYLSKDPVQVGSLRGQDIAKLVILAMLLVGTAQATYAAFGKADPASPPAAAEAAPEQPLPLVRWIGMSWSDWFGSDIPVNGEEAAQEDA